MSDHSISDRLSFGAVSHPLHQTHEASPEAIQDALDDAARALLQNTPARTLSHAERARLRATATLQNALVLTDPHLPDNPIVYANPAFLALSGYSEEEIVGFNCRFLQGPGTDRAEVARLREAIRGEIPVQVTLLNYRKDGTTFWNELTVAPVRDDHGELTHFVAVQTDVSALKETEEQLRQKAGELDAVVEQAMDGVYLFEPVGKRLLKTNAAFRAMLGCAEEEAANLTLYDIVGHGRSSIDRNVAALLRDGEAVLGERQYLRRDGSVIVAEVSARSVSYGGSTAFCVVAHDMTARRRQEAARREAEEGYRLLFESASEGIFLTSPEGFYLRANPALARIYGYESPEQMITELTDIGGQLYVEAGRREEFQRLMQKQGAVSEFESQVYRRDGSVIWISESARPVPDAAGGLRGYEGFVRDISDRRALQAQQAEALREAEERADRDPLTGLWNHRAFHRRLEEEAARAQREGTALAVAMLDLDNFKFFNEAHGHIVGDGVLRQVAGRLLEICRPYDTVARFGGDEFALLLPGAGNATAAEMETRLRGDMSGMIHPLPGQNAVIPITVSVGAALFSSLSGDRLDALHQADERLRRAKTGGDVGAGEVRAAMLNAVAGFSMLDSLVTAVDNKDRYTRRHSEDVMVHSLKIARELGLDEATQHTVAVAALLHDVGKIGVPDAILRKPGHLTEAEFEAVRQHPHMGAIMVQAVPGLEGTLDAVRHHHECWDGSGYPLGLRGKQTPLVARLMAVADAFSAMTTDRPYRKGMDPAKARCILDAGAGTQWDPDCVRAFLAAEKKAEASRSACFMAPPERTCAAAAASS